MKSVRFLYAQVVTGVGTDKVVIETNLPDPINSSGPGHNLYIGFDATKGHGGDYVREHFEIEPEIIHRSR